MTLHFALMDQTSADAIATWRYEKAYSIYDGEADGVRALLNPAYRYYAITDDRSETIGFCCFGADARVRGGAYADADALDVGAGMRPDLAGRGRGTEFVGAILEFGEETFSPAAFRVTVAAFNQRAIRVCEQAGFERVETFRAPAGGLEFAVLVRR